MALTSIKTRKAPTSKQKLKTISRIIFEYSFWYEYEDGNENMCSTLIELMRLSGHSDKEIQKIMDKTK